MSEAVLMGGTSAFKQRADAYQIAREAPAALAEAITQITHEKPKAALSILDRLHQAIELNPVAQGMVRQRDPQMLDSLTMLRAEAARLAPYEVSPTRSTEWHHPAPGWQTRLSYGRSDQGHHFRLEVAFIGQDRSQPWSRAYRSERIAELAGERIQRAETRCIARDGPQLQRGYGMSR